MTEESIASYIRTRPFASKIDHQLRSVLNIETATSAAKLKDMSDDVATLKKMFRQHVGATWAQAERINATSVLMTAAAIGRLRKPWEDYELVAKLKGKDSTASYVRRHLQTYAFRHEWLP